MLAMTTDRRLVYVLDDSGDLARILVFESFTHETRRRDQLRPLRAPRA